MPTLIRIECIILNSITDKTTILPRTIPNQNSFIYNFHLTSQCMNDYTQGVPWPVHQRFLKIDIKTNIDPEFLD